MSILEQGANDPTPENGGGQNPPAQPATPTPPENPTPPPENHPTPDQTPPTVTDFSQLINANGDLKEGWQNALPEDLKGEACLTNFKTVPSLVKSLVLAQKSIGAGKVVLPGEHATDDERAEFMSKVAPILGIPKSADAYQIKMPESAVVQFDADAQKAFCEAMFATGANNAAVQAAIDFQANMLTAKVREHSIKMEREATQISETMIQEKGRDEYERIVGLARKAADSLGIMEYVGKTPLGNNVKFIEALAKLGDSMSESSVAGAGSTSNSIPAKQRLAEIQADPAYLDGAHPRHKLLISEMSNLLKRL